MVLLRRQKLTIISLLIYWPAIFVATHISKVPRWFRSTGVSDKSLHYLVYLILVFFLWSAINPYGKVNWRRAAVWCVLFVIVWYGVFDEWLQGYVGRDPNVMDFFTDLAGTLTGLILLSLFSFWHAALIVAGIFIFVLTNLSRVNMSETLPTISATFNLFVFSFFSIIWIEYIRRFIQLQAPQAKWLGVAFILPVALLLAVRLFSVILGRGFGLTDTAVAALGITVAIFTYYITALFRCRIANRRWRATDTGVEN